MPPAEPPLLRPPPVLRPPLLRVLAPEEADSLLPLDVEDPDLRPDEADAVLPRDEEDAALAPAEADPDLPREPLPDEALRPPDVPADPVLPRDLLPEDVDLVRDPVLEDAVLERDPAPAAAVLAPEPAPAVALLARERPEAVALLARVPDAVVVLAELRPPRPPDLEALPPAEAALARPPVFALVPDLERLEEPRFARPPEDPEDDDSPEPPSDPLNSRRIVSAAALTTAEPMRLAVSAAASALSRASWPAWRAPLRTFWFAVSAAAAVTRPAAIRLRATGLLASSIAFWPTSLRALWLRSSPPASDDDPPEDFFAMLLSSQFHN